MASPLFAHPPGRRIAVLGGAGGIGRALVTELLALQAEVAVLDLAAVLERYEQPGVAMSAALNGGDEASVQAAFTAVEARFGGLDGLVNLIGFSAPKHPVAATPTPVWDEVVAGNLDSAFFCAKAALPLLAKGRDAAMVLTSSGLAYKPTPGYGPYSVAKAGLVALTRLLAQENAPAIRVNAVAPAAVDTAFLKGGTGRGGDTGDEAVRLDLAAYLKTIPLGRIAQPIDVVAPILFLLGPGAAYMTGQVLHINGGLLMP
jgi:3-oxoacyl-[acyl-carrier protein] reductase